MIQLTIMKGQEKSIHDYCSDFYEIRNTHQKKIEIKYAPKPISMEIFDICESLDLKNGKYTRVGVDEFMIYELMIKKKDPVCFELYLIKNEYDDGAARDIPPLRLSTIKPNLVSEELTSKDETWMDGYEKLEIIKKLVEFVKRKNDYLRETDKLKDISL